MDIILKIIFFPILFSFILTSTAWGENISGTWSITQKNNEGAEDTFNISIKASGEVLTISGSHQKIGALTGTGTLNGDAITMNINATGAEGKGALSFTYRGKVTGNKMSGTKETKIIGTPGSGLASGNAAGGQPPAGSGQGATGPAGGDASNDWTAEKQ